jgi:hypothetical protein
LDDAMATMMVETVVVVLRHDDMAAGGRSYSCYRLTLQRRGDADEHRCSR